MTAPSITEFLLARIAEDEAVARAAAWVPDPDEPDDDYDNPWAKDHGEFASRGGAKFTHILRNDPARVLAECAAKRAIVELYERHRENRDARRHPRARAAEDYVAVQDRRKQEARTRVAEDVIFHLAAVYRNHPDYQHEWTL